MKVFRYGKSTDMSYEDICHTLGFVPESHFVKVAFGKIGFTIGKEQEVNDLFQSVLKNGFTWYKPSEMRGHNNGR